MSGADGHATTLRLEELSVPRGGRMVVRDVSFDIPPGEVTTLLGAERRRQVEPRARGRRRAPAELGARAARRPRPHPQAPESIRAAGIAVVPEGRRLLPDAHGRGQPPRRDLRALARGAQGRDRLRAQPLPRAREALAHAGRACSRAGSSRCSCSPRRSSPVPRSSSSTSSRSGSPRSSSSASCPRSSRSPPRARACSHRAVRPPRALARQHGVRARGRAHPLLGHRRGAPEPARRPPLRVPDGRANDGGRRPGRRLTEPMRAAVTEGKGAMRIADVPDPGEPGAGRGGRQTGGGRPLRVGLPLLPRRHRAVPESELYPRVQGHEAAGVIEAIGPDGPTGSGSENGSRSGRSPPAVTAIRAGSGGRTSARTSASSGSTATERSRSGSGCRRRRCSPSVTRIPRSPR